MVFSDTTTKLGLVQEIDSLCDSDSVSYPVADKTRRLNTALEEIVGKLIARNGNWEFDDSNFTSMPIGKTDLVEGQQDYTFDVSHLIIERVEVLGVDGIWQLLNPIDLESIGGAIEEYQKASGFPNEYDKRGSSILLYPPPTATEVTLSSGLRAYFQRTASLFAATDTTKVPGFASPYHIILAYKAALPYCQSYKKDRVALYLNEVNRLEKELMNFEANKEKDIRTRLTMRGINPR